MGFMDRLKSIFNTVATDGQEIGAVFNAVQYSPYTTIKDAIGAIQAGGASGLQADLKQVAYDQKTNTIPGKLGTGILDASNVGLSYVNRAGSTFNFIASGQGDSVNDPNTVGFAAFAHDVRQGWNNSATNSYGQEYARLLDPGMSDAAYENAKKNSPVFNITSGSIDLMKNIYGDPMNLAFVGGTNIIKADRLGIAGAQRAELTAAIDTGTRVKLSSKSRQATTKILTGTVAPGRMGQAMDDFFAGTEDFRNQTMKKLGVTNLESKTTRTLVPPVETPGTHVQPSLYPEHDPQGTIKTVVEKTTAAQLRPSDFRAAFPALEATADPAAAANAFVSVGRESSLALRRQGVETILQYLYGDNAALGRLAAVQSPEFARAANVLNRAGSTLNEGELLAALGPNDPMNRALAANNLEWVKAIHGDNAVTTIQEDLDRLSKVGARSLQYMPQYNPSAVAKLGRMPGRYFGPSIDDAAAAMPLERVLQDSAQEAGVVVHGAVEERLGTLQKVANTVARAADAARPSRTANAVTIALNTRMPTGLVDLVELHAGHREIVSQLQFVGAHPDVVRHYSNAFDGAQVSKSRYAVAEETEAAAIKILAARSGVSKSTADQIVRDLRQTRAGAGDSSGGSVLSAATNPETGKRVGTVPLVQQPNSFNAVDLVQLSKLLKREGRHIQAGEDFIAQAQKAFGPTADGLYETADQILHFITKVSKFSMLFRAGYAARNLVDNDLRTYSQLGAKIATTVLIDRIGVIGQAALRTNSHRALLSRALKAQTEATTLEGMIAAGSAPAGAAERVAALNDQIDRGILAFRKEVGQARKGPTVGVNTLPPAFEDTSSAQRVQGGVATGQVNDLASAMNKNLSAHGGYKIIEPGHPDWSTELTKVVNNQIAQDPAFMRVVNGDNIAGLETWLTKDAEGRRYLKQIGTDVADAHLAASDLFYHAKHYTPGPIAQRLRNGGKVMPDEISKWFPSATDQFQIHGQSLGLVAGQNPLGHKISKLMDAAMKMIGDLPDDALTRHPLFAATYNAEGKRYLEMIPDGQLLGNKEVKAMANAGREVALRQVRRTLFAGDRYTSAAQKMRHISPFFAAYQEGVHSYGRIFTENPHALYRISQAWNSPNNLGIVVNDKGEPVKGSDGITTNDKLVLQLKGWGGKKWAEGHGFFGVQISKTSYNIITQGDPFYSPGFGPLAQFGISKLVKTFPKTEDVYKTFISSYGAPTGFWNAFLPATGKRVQSVLQQENDTAWTQAFGMNITDLQTEVNLGKHKPANVAQLEKEAKDRTNQVMWLRVANNALNPFPPSPVSEFQFFRDQYHALQEVGRTDHAGDPGWADRQFIMDNGDAYFPIMQSISKSNAGVQATANTQSAASKYKDIIGTLQTPRLMGAIIGPEGTGKFSSTVYGNQYGDKINRLDSGDANNVRSRMSPDDAAVALQVNAGWFQYQKVITDLNAMAIERGGQSYKDFADLSAVTHTLINQLGHDANGNANLWFDDFMSHNAQDFESKVLPDMANIVAAPGLAKRPDIQLLAQYLTVRNQFKAMLMQRQAAGGSGTMTTKANVDIATAYANFVGMLANQNTVFSENWVSKWIDHDPLYVDKLAVGSQV